jgi:1-aminocyclopropane-1-carboxylate deaminase/D-cysteine desulfhydrase-like pyridoxal-dependent ACC family enzyme
MLNNLPEIKLQAIENPIFKDKKLSVYMLRLDQSDQTISGNKWFKLKYNLIEAKKHNYKTLLTFGGAYSNHIHATASAARQCGFSSIGIIRGEPTIPLNQTLTDVTHMGMHLHYINRNSYRSKKDPDFLASLINRFSPDYGKIYIVPEGGTNSLALKGAAEIPELITINYDYICLACGTGGTLAGIAAALKNQDKINILGFAALKRGNFLYDEIKQLLALYDRENQQLNIVNKPFQYNNWSLNLDYHFGGFGKKNKQLQSFIENFYMQHQIELDFVYTGKMMFGIYELCKQNYFKSNTTIVVIHTGGVQGNRSEKLNCKE